MCGAACGVWRCGAFVHKYSYARAYLFIRHVLNSARIACKPRQTASGVFMRLFSMYGYVTDIQCVAPFCALIGFFPACGRASFAMRKSPFRSAAKPFPDAGTAFAVTQKSLFGKSEEAFPQSGKTRSVCLFRTMRWFTETCRKCLRMAHTEPPALFPAATALSRS